MDKKNIQVLEDIKVLINEMYFRDLQGKELFGKILLIQDFLKVIKELKEPIKPVKKKPIKKIKEDKVDAKS